MKSNNNKKICLNTLSKGFLALSLFLLSLGFFGITSASADVGIQTLELDNNYVTIPANSGNSALFCNSYTITTYDSEPMTLALTHKISGSDISESISYVLNPAVGSHLIGNGSNFINCYFITGVNANNLIAKAETNWQNGEGYNYSFYNTFTSTDNLVIGFYSHDNKTIDENLLTSTSSSIIYHNQGGGNYPYSKNFGNRFALYNYSNGNLITQNFSLNYYYSSYEWSNPSQVGWLELNIATGGSDGFDYVQYDNSQGQAEIFNNKLNWKVYYNLCDKAYPPNGGHANIYLEGDYFGEGSNYRTIIGGQVGPSNCKGFYTFDETFLGNNSAIGTSNANISIDTFDENSDYIQTIKSDNFIVYNINKKTYPNSAIIYSGNDPLNIDVSTTTNTPLNFIYNICSVDDWASSTFWLYNLDVKNNSDFYYSPSECSGLGTINITNGTSTDFYYIFNADIRLENENNNNLLNSNNFKIEFESSINDTSIKSIFGDTAYNLACSTDEWNAQNALFPVCSIKYGWLNILDMTIKSVTSNINKLKNQLVSMFPLNIPKQIMTSWKNSENTVMNENLNFLNVKEADNSIKGYLPKEWIGTQENLSFDIFSKNMLTQGNNEMSNLFDKFKSFTVFLQWALFALGFINWSKGVYFDITNKLHNDKNI